MARIVLFDQNSMQPTSRLFYLHEQVTVVAHGLQADDYITFEVTKINAASMAQACGCDYRPPGVISINSVQSLLCPTCESEDDRLVTVTASNPVVILDSPQGYMLRAVYHGDGLETGEVAVYAQDTRTQDLTDAMRGCAPVCCEDEDLVWQPTGVEVCDGEDLRVEEASQCGQRRWVVVEGGANWVASGTIACTGETVSELQVNRCGHLRWEDTGVPVEWQRTGLSQCVSGTLRMQESNQCGQTRWIDSGVVCDSGGGGSDGVFIDPETGACFIGNGSSEAPLGLDIECIKDQLDIPPEVDISNLEWSAFTERPVHLKPSAKAVIKPLIDDRLANRFERWYPARFGVPGICWVFQDLVAWSGAGVQKPPGFILYVPEAVGDEFTFNLNLDVPEAPNSVTVSLFRFSGDNTEAGIVVDPDIEGEDGRYTIDYTGVSDTSNVGLRVVFNAANHGEGSLFAVREAGIYRNDDLVVRLSDYYDELYTSIVSRATNSMFGPLLKQDFGDWAVAHNYAVTGQNPRVIWAAPTGGNETPADNTTMMLMNTEGNPSTAQWASMWARTYQRNGFTDIPARAYHPGVYDMATYGGSGQPVYVNQSLGDIIAFAPYGPAYFIQNNGDCDGFVFATQQRGGEGEPPPVNVYLWDLHGGTGASSDGVDTSNCCRVPTRLRFLNGTVYAYSCSISWSDPSLNANGWWFDDTDAVLEKCVAQNAGLDGFNTHGYGHIALIDCEARDCTDDGFSPHDSCTYEVWGGLYERNGKGNVIPAFGAQGFCNGVTSRDLAGTSGAVEGDNSGGFVCLSLDGGTRQTTLLCIDCVSEGDNNGFNAAGDRSLLRMLSCTATGATRAGITSGEWRDSTGGTVLEGGTVLSGNAEDRIIPDPSKHTQFRY